MGVVGGDEKRDRHHHNQSHPSVYPSLCACCGVIENGHYVMGVGVGVDVGVDVDVDEENVVDDVVGDDDCHILVLQLLL